MKAPYDQIKSEWERVQVLGDSKEAEWNCSTRQLI